MHESKANEWIYYVAQIGHDLRTPLNIIKGFGELLDQEMAGPLNPKQHIYTKKIIKESDALLYVINQLLDWARLSGDKVVLSPEQTDLYLLGLEIQGQFELRMEQTGVQLINDIPKGTVVELDKNKFRQVLVNIVYNAFKFTQSGGEVHLAIRQDDAHLYLDIRDSGRGMNPEQVGRIFNAFDTAGEAVEADGHGAGLGLWIARSIVQAHGGALVAESVPGLGSTFTISLPKGADAL